MGFSCGDGGMEGSSIGFGEVWGAAIGMQGPAVGMEGHGTQLWEWRDEEPIYRVGRGMGRSQRDGDAQELAVGLERCREQITEGCKDQVQGWRGGNQPWGWRDARTSRGAGGVQEPAVGLEGHQCLP